MRSLSPWQKKLLSKRTLIIVLLVFVMIALFIIRGDRASDQTLTYVVSTRDVEQAVQLTGVVEAVDQVDLSFATNGTVKSVAIKQGDPVVAGDILLELDHDALDADLAQAQSNRAAAQSNVAFAQASLERAQAALDLIRAQNRGSDTGRVSVEDQLINTQVEQATLVSNAYAELLNNDLAAYPTLVNETVVSPIISGSYLSDDAGTYELQFYRSSAGTGLSARYTGLETGTITFDNYGIPIALGTRGLFIALPSDGDSYNYNNSEWEVPIPNTRSGTYQTKLSLYERALETQTQAIQQAEAAVAILDAQEASGIEIVSVTSAQEAQAAAAVQEARAVLAQRVAATAQADAAVAAVEARIEDARIRAPFSGVVAKLDVTVGENVPAQSPLVTIITSGQYELRMNVPEIEVAKIAVGDETKIRLDVYGESAEWEGTVESIELIETKVDGVPVYESTIVVANPDNRMRVGMNARARILLAAESNVLAVPASYVVTVDDTAQVLVRTGDRLIEDRMVELGILGTDSFYHIRSGVQADETLVKPTK